MRESRRLPHAPAIAKPLLAALDERRVVGGESGDRARAFAIAPEQSAVLPEMLAEESGRSLRCSEILRSIEDLRRARESRDHQAIP